jgi:hypothetical protein
VRITCLTIFYRVVRLHYNWYPESTLSQKLSLRIVHVFVGSQENYFDGTYQFVFIVLRQIMCVNISRNYFIWALGSHCIAFTFMRKQVQRCAFLISGDISVRKLVSILDSNSRRSISETYFISSSHFIQGMYRIIYTSRGNSWSQYQSAHSACLLLLVLLGCVTSHNTACQARQNMANHDNRSSEPAQMTAVVEQQ